jgi:hypothetical protein
MCPPGGGKDFMVIIAPNRAVKPGSADGTAFIGGRVSRRQTLLKSTAANVVLFFYEQRSE